MRAEILHNKHIFQFILSHNSTSCQFTKSFSHISSIVSVNRFDIKPASILLNCKIGETAAKCVFFITAFSCILVMKTWGLPIAE